MTTKAKSLNAVKWSAIDRLGSQGVQFVISIILARLLLPEQFGLIAMLTIFFAVAQSFLDSGFGSALIQKKDPSHLDKCSIFYFNIAVGSAFTLLIYASAPLIADFYSQPVLLHLTQFLSLNLIINSFSIIQYSILSKELNFKSHARISLLSASISGVVGVSLALNGFGVWSLAIQQLLSSVTRSVLLWHASTWRPTFEFSLASLKQLFGFGSKMLVAGLLDNFFTNLYTLVIGKLFPPALLGFYTYAQKLKDVVALNLTQIITRVTFPVFSSIQYENEKLKRGLKKALVLSTFLIFPAMIGLAASAEALVVVLLTEKWLPSVLYLQLLCVVGMLLPLQALNLSIIKSKGRSDLYLWLEILKKTLIVVNILVTWRWGIEAIIWGQVVLSCISYFMNSFFAKHLINYSALEQIKDVLPSAILAVIMGAGVFSVRFILPSNSYTLLLIAQVLFGCIFYVILTKLFNKTLFNEIMALISNRQGLVTPK